MGVTPIDRKMLQLISRATEVARKLGIQMSGEQEDYETWLDHFCTAAENAAARRGKEPSSKERMHREMFGDGSDDETPAYMLSTRGLSPAEARIFTRKRDDYLARGGAGLAQLKDLGCGKQSLDRLAGMLKGTTFRMATTNGEPGDTLGAVEQIEAAVELLSDAGTRRTLKLLPWSSKPTLTEIDAKRAAQVADVQLSGAGMGALRE